jgi:hypothetical protein
MSACSACLLFLFLASLGVIECPAVVRMIFPILVFALLMGKIDTFDILVLGKLETDRYIGNAKC